LVQRGQQLQRDLPELERSLRHSLEQIAADALDPQTRSLRVTTALRSGEAWRLLIAPMLEGAASRLAESASHLDEVDEVLRKLDNNELNRQIQAVFDIRRAARRLGEMAAVCTAMLGDQGDHVRWIEEQHERGQPVPTAALHLAPLEIGPQLRSQVFEPLRTVVATSATITVNGQFQHWQERVGLVDAEGLPDLIATGVFPSPFDYARQALLAIPRDIPDPDAADFDERAAAVLIEAIEISRGGVFVLCTSFRMVDSLHRRVEAALGRRFLLLRHGEMGRERLLQRFREGGNAVLFGTDSFWEGVSVAGEALRLVVIPRLPFRVPTEPVQQARYELIEARGANAFSSYALPQAVLRLRQGFGRLIRTASDRGVVLILDRRVSDRWYGRIFLQSLPRLPRAVGPWKAVAERMFSLYQGGGPADDEPTLGRG
jgi:ATP-dependent DNA helicase DinG